MIIELFCYKDDFIEESFCYLGNNGKTMYIVKNEFNWKDIIEFINKKRIYESEFYIYENIKKDLVNLKK